MPELPEVETIRRQLDSYMPAKILSVSFSQFSSSIVRVKEFSLKQKTIQSITRYGKVLQFVLDDNQFILSQLGMSGGWIVSDCKVVEKHAHIQLKCENEKQIFFMAYVDPRRFGNLYIVNEKQRDLKIGSMGVDVSSSEFTVEYVSSVLAKYPNREIKPLLLEQKYFAGIGNYMASEILGLSGILPTRHCLDITKSEIKRMCQATRKVIDKSISSRGLSFHGGYRDASGEKGEALTSLVIFNQKICQLCQKTAVVKITQNGRGTYFCPKCQK